MNETIVVENGQAAVATTSVSGTLSPASSATDTIAIVDTPAGKQAALKVYNLNGGGGGGGEVSGDYLPLSGGTLTGALEISLTPPYQNYTLSFLKLKYVGQYEEKTLGIGYDGRDIGLGYAGLRTTGTISAGASDTYDLGSKYIRWRTVYAQKINVGSIDGVVGNDLIVPSEGGTIARIEDIDAVVGNISTALTAILGE